MLLKSLLLHNTLHIFEIECKVIKKKLNYQTFLVIFYLSPVKTGKKDIFFTIYKILKCLFSPFMPFFHDLPKPPFQLIFST